MVHPQRAVTQHGDVRKQEPAREPPVEGVDDNWRIGYFSIARFNNNGYIKSCGNIVAPFEVPNMGYVSGSDSYGDQTVPSNEDVVVTVEPGITLDKLAVRNKRVTARLTNLTGEAKTIEEILVIWPEDAGNLIKVRLDDIAAWTGSAEPPTTTLDVSDDGWVLQEGEAILRLDFESGAKDVFEIRLIFSDSTFLEIHG